MHSVKVLVSVFYYLNQHRLAAGSLLWMMDYLNPDKIKQPSGIPEGCRIKSKLGFIVSA